MEISNTIQGKARGDRGNRIKSCMDVEFIKSGRIGICPKITQGVGFFRAVPRDASGRKKQ
jgi:hypothetical protein